ncbi:MAG: ParB/RepB/Spo0J family partition protein [Clostridia bacterium]|nr:ParB/RepB/Spo0J family partition protein [Clostridia bacterium]
MAKKAHGLGRGLDSLFADQEDWGSGNGTSIQEISIGELDPNPDQPRKHFDEETMAQLSESIRDQGVLQPLIVVPASNGRYRIIAGERRYRACRMAGMETVPCVIRDLDIVRQMEISLIENLQREDLNPVEEARGIRALMQQCGYTQEKVAQRLGKSRPAVANLIRLLNLPEEVTDMVRDGLLTAGHARVLAGLSDSRTQITLAKKAADEGLNVRQMEALAAKIKGEESVGRKQKPPKPLAPELRELQDRLLEKTGMRAVLSGTPKKGKIVLQYSSLEELNRLHELLERIEA